MISGKQLGKHNGIQQLEGKSHCAMMTGPHMTTVARRRAPNLAISMAFAFKVEAFNSLASQNCAIFGPGIDRNAVNLGDKARHLANCTLGFVTEVQVPGSSISEIMTFLK